MNTIPNPIIPERCSSTDHWFNLIVQGECLSCMKQFASAEDQDEPFKRMPPPSDDEINGMYAVAETESAAYRTAH